MRFPDVEIRPGDSIHKADERIERAFEEIGETLLAFDSLNSLLDTSSECHFFRIDRKEESCVLVVNVGSWEERTILPVLNILLGMRVDPDPPGSRPRFHFYSREPVPAVLYTLFGPESSCEFESRACLAARFGDGLRAEHCTQLGAVGAWLSRACFSVDVDFKVPGGERAIEEIIDRHFLTMGDDREPLNSLLVLGCLFGEIIRCRLPWRSRWVRFDAADPWPGIVLSSHRAHGGVENGELQVAFSPISRVIRHFRRLEGGSLGNGLRELEARCREVFAAPSSP